MSGAVEKRVGGAVGRLFTTVAAAALIACVGSPTCARAAFTAPRLLSAAAGLQFSEADAPAVSADGDYVVFQGVYGSVSGVFRRNLATGEVAPVATSYTGGRGKLGAPSQTLSAPDAAAPSVSGEGRYVAFTTASNLGDQPEYQSCPQVYVRDMDMEASASGAYVLASALNESSSAIHYEANPHVPQCPAPAEKPESFPVAGAQAAPGVAISADGRYVVFTIDSPSNLHGAGEPSAGGPTPPGQVALRDLREQRTALVTTTPTGAAVPEGGAFPSTYALQYGFGERLTASSASISAEGNAVAWLGTDVSEQTPGAKGGPEEVEPLWRAIAQGALASPPTRLLADAGLDLEYELPPQNPVRTGSRLTEGGDFVVPALSGDGRTVALEVNAPPLSAAASALRKGGEVLPSDAYVVKVDESGQPQQVLSVTATPNYLAAPPALGNIEYLAISPDGSRVAFATNRTQFAPAAVVPISPSIPFNGQRETYVANIEDGTLERVTSTFDGSPPNGAAELSSFSGDGRTLAFVSEATNLLWGDVVAAREVYASQAAQSGSERTPEVSIGGEGAFSQPPPEWTLDAIALPQRDGSVIVRALVPGAGRLDVSATSPVSKAKRPRVLERPRDRKRSAHRAARSAHSAAGAPVLARAGAVTDVPTQVQVHLNVTPSLRARVDGRAGLYAIVRVSFSSPGHSPLTSELPVVFHRQAQPRGRRR